MNNIYMLEIRDDYHDVPDYGYHDAHIVVAKDEEEARRICPYSDEGDIWTDDDKTDCKIVGKSKLDTIILLSSYNAG